MKYLLGAVAGLTLFVGVAASQPADAACWWNGYGWHCSYPHHYYYHHWYHPYRWGY